NVVNKSTCFFNRETCNIGRIVSGWIGITDSAQTPSRRNLGIWRDPESRPVVIGQELFHNCPRKNNMETQRLKEVSMSGGRTGIGHGKRFGSLILARLERRAICHHGSKRGSIRVAVLEIGNDFVGGHQINEGRISAIDDEAEKIP